MVRDKSGVTRYLIDQSLLPNMYPTHRHSPEFWEALGRTVGTFGHLEEILGKAILAFTITREIPENELETELKKCLPVLKGALSDPLGPLIKKYGEVVRNHEGATISNLDALLTDLCRASKYRNVLCHGSWYPPDENGKSLPFFVNKKQEMFQIPIDAPFLEEMRKHLVELVCSVRNSVTQMGFTFPGSGGPGNPVLCLERGSS